MLIKLRKALQKNSSRMTLHHFQYNDNQTQKMMQIKLINDANKTQKIMSIKFRKE